MMAIRAGVKLAPVYHRHEEAPIPQDAHHNRRALSTPEYTGRKGTAEEYTANAHEVMRRAYALGGIECR